MNMAHSKSQYYRCIVAKSYNINTVIQNQFQTLIASPTFSLESLSRLSTNNVVLAIYNHAL